MLEKVKPGGMETGTGVERPRAGFRDCGVLGSVPLVGGPPAGRPLDEVSRSPGASRFSRISIRPARFLMLPGFLSSRESPIIVWCLGLPSPGACVISAGFHFGKTLPVPNQDNACPHISTRQCLSPYFHSKLPRVCPNMHTWPSIAASIVCGGFSLLSIRDSISGL